MPAARAVEIIRDEHRALSAVLHGLCYLIREIRQGGAAPDFDLLAAMVSYIDRFPERVHHPKEERHLFARLRTRWPAAAPLLERLQGEHEIGARRLRDVAHLLRRYRQHGASSFERFAASVDGFAAFHREHMRREETDVIPLARLHLTPEDWADIDAAFTAHTDPLLDVDAAVEYQALFRRIVALAPPPIGSGSSARMRR